MNIDASHWRTALNEDFRLARDERWRQADAVSGNVNGDISGQRREDALRAAQGLRKARPTASANPAPTQPYGAAVQRERPVPDVPPGSIILRPDEFAIVEEALTAYEAATYGRNRR